MTPTAAIASHIRNVWQNIVGEKDELCGARWIMRDSPNYALKRLNYAQNYARAQSHNSTIPI